MRIKYSNALLKNKIFIEENPPNTINEIKKQNRKVLIT